MDSVVLIYKLICDLPGVFAHSDVAPHPKDIDLYVHPSSLTSAKDILEDSGYVCVKNSEHHAIYSKFVEGELFMFDLCGDYNYYFELYPAIKLSELGNSSLGNDIDLNKAVKKLVNLKDPSDSDIERLINFFSFHEYFICGQPTKNPNRKSINNLRVSIARQRFARLLILRLNLFIKNFNRGTSFAFVGPDGSGKGFFIDKLSKAISHRIIYMGDWFFTLQPAYSLIMKIPSPLNRFVYIFYYLENLIRRFRVAMLIIIGKTVFIDRFPGTNTPVMLSGLAGSINRLFFRITPKPDLFVILYASPEIVFTRKQELEINEIAAIQRGQKKLLSKYNHIVINTEKLDESLNYLLGKLYEN